MKFSKPNNIKALLLFSAAVLLLEIITYKVGGGKTCYLKGIIGIPCPGCGLTRSFINFFHGNFREAFFYHPLFFTIPAVFSAMVVQKTAKSKSSVFNWIYICTAVLFIIVFIIRMIIYFPDTSPMDFNGHSVLMKGFHFLME